MAPLRINILEIVIWKERGGFYEESLAFDNLLKAYLKTGNKRYREEFLKLSFFLEETLFEIQDDLEVRLIKHGGYGKFIVRDPKKRELKPRMQEIESYIMPFNNLPMIHCLTRLLLIDLMLVKKERGIIEHECIFRRKLKGKVSVFA